MNPWLHRRRAGLLALLLGAITLGVFAPVRHFEFIELDDPEYVSANAAVQQGFTLAGIKWAFQPGHSGNWHPLTWLSHMADAEFFGLDAGRHHLVNVLLHSLNAALLLLVWRRLTGALWRSCFVAALFAWHPLHVESVAWIAERKDVLSGCFFILTLGAYARYVELIQADPGQSSRARRWYGGTLLLFVLGLMSKPMLVTLPFVLLLLDGWPLQRFQFGQPTDFARTGRRLIAEKLPFFLIVLASCLITVVAQKQGQAVISLEQLATGDRLENALSAYVKYLGRTFWPADLAIFYPHPSLPYAAASRWAGGQIAAGGALLLVLSGVAVLRWRRAPWLATGWFWFLGTLVPVIGILQVGGQALADRYTYLPLIGIFIAVTWLAAELAGRNQLARRALPAVGLAVVAGCAVLARRQLGHWRNGIELFTHACAVTSHNPKMQFSLGQSLFKAGRLAEATAHFRTALADDPKAPETHYALARALAEQGQVAEAVDEFQNVLSLVPGHQNATDALGELLLARGAQAMRAGKTNDAATIFQAARATRSDLAERALGAGQTLARQGQWPAALSNITLASWIKPDNAATQLELAWLLATSPTDALRNGSEALRIVEWLRSQSPKESPSLLLAQAAAYAELNRFAEATATATQARELAERAGLKVLAGQAGRLLACFEAKQPFRQTNANDASANPP